jgi:hypothetical protein
MVSVANNSGLRLMIAGSVANNVGFGLRQLHLIPVEKCADCWFMCLRLQVATASGSSWNTVQRTIGSSRSTISSAIKYASPLP